MTDYVVYYEGKLALHVPKQMKSENFDDVEKHGLSHCLKAVDFVVETSTHILFIEFKDPDHPGAREKDKMKFVNSFRSGALDSDLCQKFRDTWLYKKSENGLPHKPIRYVVLVACSALMAPEYLSRTDYIRTKLPVRGKPGQDWSWFVEDCVVLSIEKWNEVLEKMPITRI